MKKIILLAMFLPAIAFAQNEKKYTVSGNLNVSEPSQLGISVEYAGKEKDGRNHTAIFNLSAGRMEIDGPLDLDIDGNGFVIEAGSRTYESKGKWNGWYAENLLAYGNIKFDENFGGLGRFEGTYSYFSLINPNIGYKINVGSGITIDPSIGFNWKWEIKGKGDVDNKDIDNLIYKFGVKVGYSF